MVDNQVVSGTGDYPLKAAGEALASPSSSEPAVVPSQSSDAPVPAVLRANVAPLLKGD